VWCRLRRRGLNNAAAAACSRIAAEIKAIIAGLPTYGYRRVHAMLRRRRRQQINTPAVNFIMPARRAGLRLVSATAPLPLVA
jgi:hypothetical protein